MENFLESLNGVNWDLFLYDLLRIGALFVIGYLLSLTARFTSRRLERYLQHRTQAPDEGVTEASKRVGTLMRLMRQALHLIIWIGVSLAVLKEFGLDIGPILASVGVLGIAIGFGAQSLVRDFISGFFFILENQVRVGDVAIINGTGGLVEELNFRTIVLRDLEGVVHVFPNGTVTTLSNMTREWSAYLFNIGIAYKDDPDRAIQVMQELAAEMRVDPVHGPHIINDLEVFGVDSFAESALMIKARLQTRPGQQWGVGREFLRRLKHRFDAAGIEIPVPHRTLRLEKADDALEIELLNRARRKTRGNG